VNHEAIYKAYPNVRSINDQLGAFDDNGNKVAIDQAVVAQVAVQLNLENGWTNVRSKRDALLVQSDWTQLSDSSADKVAWASYRQALRDIPQNFSNPEDVTWPAKPE
jgi:hypothetical protein